LHREVRHAIEISERVHRHDARMLQQSDDLGLELESLQCSRIHGRGEWEEF
jgi:hypothetical protein